MFPQKSIYTQKEIHPTGFNLGTFLFSVKGRRFVLHRGEGALKRSEDIAVTGHSALLQNVSKGDTDAQPNFVSQSFFYNLPSLVEPGLLTGFHSLVEPWAAVSCMQKLLFNQC